MNCDNCNANFDPTVDGLRVCHGNRVASGLCPECTRSVVLGKIVLRRDAQDRWSYMQWEPLEVFDGPGTRK